MKPRHRLATLARGLHNNATDAERLLWQYLRNSQIEGVKFRRQQPIEEYIADFVSFSPKLVIELDGGQHALDEERDRRRDECLRRNGFTVLRFWNNEVIGNIEGVLEVIRRQCLGEVSRGCSRPHPLPPSREGRGNSRPPAPSREGMESKSRDVREGESRDGIGAEGFTSLAVDGRTNSPSPRGRGLGGGGVLP